MAQAAPRPPAPATPPHFTVPAGACDTHFHLYEFSPRFPISPERGGDRLEATRADYRRMQQAIGTERGVVVNSGFYGRDNSLLLDVLRENADMRGIARIDAKTSEADFAELAACGGVRGIRVTTRSAESAILGEIELLCERIRPLGWHLQLHVSPPILCDLAPRLERLPVTIVIDHMARLPSDAVNGPAFQALARLLATGRLWVKLSAPYRNTAQEPPYRELVPLGRALVALAPDRMVWGTDWPNVNYAGTMPDAGMLLDCLADWAPDPATRNRILVDNPEQLYGF